jgi:hypothetical protein
MEEDLKITRGDSATNVGENYITQLYRYYFYTTGIIFRLKNGLAKNVVQEVILTLVDFVLIL